MGQQALPICHACAADTACVDARGTLHGPPCPLEMPPAQRTPSKAASGAADGPKKPLSSAQIQQSFRDRQKARRLSRSDMHLLPSPSPMPRIARTEPIAATPSQAKLEQQEAQIHELQAALRQMELERARQQAELDTLSQFWAGGTAGAAQISAPLRDLRISTWVSVRRSSFLSTLSSDRSNATTGYVKSVAVCSQPVLHVAPQAAAMAVAATVPWRLA